MVIHLSIFIWSVVNKKYWDLTVVNSFFRPCFYWLNIIVVRNAENSKLRRNTSTFFQRTIYFVFLVLLNPWNLKTSFQFQ